MTDFAVAVQNQRIATTFHRESITANDIRLENRIDCRQECRCIFRIGNIIKNNASHTLARLDYVVLLDIDSIDI